MFKGVGVFWYILFSLFFFAILSTEDGL